MLSKRNRKHVHFLFLRVKLGKVWKNLSKPGVQANGPSKTRGLAKFPSNCMGLAVSFFLAVINNKLHLAVSIFFHKAVSDSFVCFYKHRLNVLESEHLVLAFKTL